MLAVNSSLVVLGAALVMASASGTTTEPSPGSSEPATGDAAGIVGSWHRAQTCEEMLVAFDAAGLTESHLGWLQGNFFGGEPGPTEGDVCEGAQGPLEHSHFFTDDGAFGSHDEHGEQVDEGDYELVDEDTLAFPSHASEFGYDGDLVVDYQIDGDIVTFDVVLPEACEETCKDAYAWALSAFASGPWTRSAEDEDDGQNVDGSSPLFTTDQLDTLVAEPGDAPPSTRFDDSQSGPASLDVLSQGVESARSMFEELGYQGGQTAIFVSTDSPPPVGAIIGSGVFIFKDAAAASEALNVHASVVVPEVLQGYEEIPVENLGDERFAFTFESGPAGSSGAIYEFRIGNAVFLFPGSGESMDRDALLELAQAVASRVPG